MKKGLVIVGVLLLVVGLLMMLFLWPMIGTIDEDEAAEKLVNAEEGTYKVITEIDDDEWEEIELLKEDETALEFAEAIVGVEGFYDNIDGPGTYTYTLEINGPLDFKMSKPVKVPTMGGIIGVILLLVGIILLIVGAVKGKPAPMAPMGPPMDQPPMGPPMDQPPMGQPPMQPPPGQPPNPPY